MKSSARDLYLPGENPHKPQLSSVLEVVHGKANCLCSVKMQVVL